MSAQWEKVLWKQQNYPDNYIPQEYFLSALRKNPNFRPYSYWPVALLSGAVTQHLATIFIFLSVFVRLKERLLDPRILVWISIACFAVGYAVWEFMEWRTQDGKPDRVKTIKSSILTFLALMALSPVLRTLTAATSSDSIWALSAALFALNALLADYRGVDHRGLVRERLTSVLSMNAAISSSVVLASRLSSDLAVFALVLFSVQVFALFPILRHRLQRDPAYIHVSLTIILSVTAVGLTSALSSTIACLYSAVLLSVSFLAPGVLVWSQKFKNEIRGPWDVAVPKVN